ncbi:hypothetical protein SAY86_016253 [Trapa natans]|uniref:Uncharacterized protein n=1 Tax=Trapa natans TaxID=22666 RepID=A0AAN7LJX4_TRANT|nr:hypothetical protein SAY86_016253 [Trapa natans]
MAFSELTMASIAICLLLAQSAAREVRPSDHGLSQQQGSPPTGEASPPEMLSFFGASSSPPASSPSSALPNVSDSTDSLWMHSSNRRDRVREILLVASLVCGVAGVALLIGSGLLCLFKSQKENRSASKSTSPRQRTLAPPPRAGKKCKI